MQLFAATLLLGSCGSSFARALPLLLTLLDYWNDCVPASSILMLVRHWPLPQQNTGVDVLIEAAVSDDNLEIGLPRGGAAESTS